MGEGRQGKLMKGVVELLRGAGQQCNLAREGGSVERGGDENKYSSVFLPPACRSA